MFHFHKLKNQDLLLVFLTILLSGIGLATVFSTTFYDNLGASSDFKQQLIFFLVGILAYLAIITLDSTLLSQPKVQIILVVITTAMLVALLLFGERISGTKRWFNLGGFSFQPSELAKIIVIITTSATFASIKEVIVQAPLNVYEKVKQREWKDLFKNEYIRRFIFNALSVLIIVTLIRAQPSLGNSLITFTLWILMLVTLVKNPLGLYAYGLIFLLGMNILIGVVNLNAVYDSLGFSFRWGRVDLIVLVTSLIITLVLLRMLRLRVMIVAAIVIAAMIVSLSADFVWNHALTGYQQDRIVAFMNPDADPLGAQWQVNQAKIAIGSGQVFGKGFLKGTQSNLGLLPFAYTDFAYAAFTEQFGLVGSLVLLGLLYLMVLRVFQIAATCEDNFGRMICIGVALMLSLNVIVNVGMNLGIMPVTGVPLPFISYGGSAVLVNFIGIGLVQMVNAEFNDRGHQHAERLTEAPL